MFDAPLHFVMPDGRLPNFGDSKLLALTRYAELFEVAYARYGNPAYRQVLARSNRTPDYALLVGVSELPPSLAEKPSSHNYPNSGYAVLTAGHGRNAPWLCLDYGSRGSHGHLDQLGFILYGMGQVVGCDPGTICYASPLYRDWYRTSLAHNTLVVDQQPQKPAAGQCEVFVTGAGFQAVTARAGLIYEGVVFRRTVALIGDDLVVFVDQVQADREHTFDLAYHNSGRLVTMFGGESATFTTRPGYIHLQDVRRLRSSNSLALEFDLNGRRRSRWLMAGGSATDYYYSTGIGEHTADRVPCVLLGVVDEKPILLVY